MLVIRPLDFADWFVGLKNNILNSHQNHFKNKLVGENAVKRATSFRGSSPTRLDGQEREPGSEVDLGHKFIEGGSSGLWAPWWSRVSSLRKQCHKKAQINNNSRIPGGCALAAPRGLWYATLHLGNQENLVLTKNSYHGHPGSYRFRVLGPVEYTRYNCT